MTAQGPIPRISRCFVALYLDAIIGMKSFFMDTLKLTLQISITQPKGDIGRSHGFNDPEFSALGTSDSVRAGPIGVQPDK